MENVQTKKVTVFSTPTCPWCVRVKQYLKSQNVSFEDVNVWEDQERGMEMVMRSGHQGVPQLWIDDEVVVGFDKEAIDEVLGLN